MASSGPSCPSAPSISHRSRRDFLWAWKGAPAGFPCLVKVPPPSSTSQAGQISYSSIVTQMGQTVLPQAGMHALIAPSTLLGGTDTPLPADSFPRLENTPINIHNPPRMGHTSPKVKSMSLLAPPHPKVGQTPSLSPYSSQRWNKYPHHHHHPLTNSERQPPPKLGPVVPTLPHN